LEIRTARSGWPTRFQGLPESNPRDYPVDEGDQHFTLTPYLGVPAEQVKANFRRYGLLGSQVKLLEGYFKDTLHASPMAQITLLRLDGDMYESTIQVLQALYPRVSPGRLCHHRPVLDYRAQEGIESAIVEVNWTGVYWRRE
jgi:O-methyltransferase